MKTIFLITALLLSSFVISQKGDELLVYSLQGDVTVMEGNNETKLKVGKVLKKGSMIKTKKNARLTMVCKEGRPISVTREGEYQVDRWKDSCISNHASVTTRYFQYIWDQMYVRSDEYKKEHTIHAGIANAPIRGTEENDLVTNAWLDSLNFTGAEFPVSWSTVLPYKGRFHFELISRKTGKVLFRESLDKNLIQLGRLNKYMKPGNLYSWSVVTDSNMVTGGIINFSKVATLNLEIQRIKSSVEEPEDLPAQYFRIAFTLRETGWLAGAYSYFQKAAAADPESELFADALKEFKSTFFIQ